jgi:hypothetical protein
VQIGERATRRLSDGLVSAQLSRTPDSVVEAALMFVVVLAQRLSPGDRGAHVDRVEQHAHAGVVETAVGGVAGEADDVAAPDAVKAAAMTPIENRLFITRTLSLYTFAKNETAKRHPTRPLGQDEGKDFTSAPPLEPEPDDMLSCNTGFNKRLNGSQERVNEIV